MPLLQANETAVTGSLTAARQSGMLPKDRFGIEHCARPETRHLLQIGSGGIPTFQDASTSAFFTSVIGALVLSLRLLIASSWPDAAAKGLSCSWYCQTLAC